MTLLQSVTVGSGGAASITFSAISDTFTDLLILFSGRVTENTTAVDIAMTFNGSTSGYSGRTLFGTGSSVGSDPESGSQFSFLITFPGNSTTANTFGNAAIYIPNYTASVAKSVSIDGVMENNATAGRLKIAAGLWNNTAAITSVTLDPGGPGNLAQYSSASLYGITAGSDGIVSVS